MEPNISRPICQAPPSLAGHIIVSAQDERPFLTRWIPRISEPVGGEEKQYIYYHK